MRTGLHGQRQGRIRPLRTRLRVCGFYFRNMPPPSMSIMAPDRYSTCGAQQHDGEGCHLLRLLDAAERQVAERLLPAVLVAEGRLGARLRQRHDPVGQGRSRD